MYNDSSIVTCANPDNNRDDPYDATYTFNVTGISRGTAFYVKLSKTEYTGYKFIGNITISD